MKKCFVAASLVASIVLVGYTMAGESVKSGPRVGQNARPMPFFPLNNGLMFEREMTLRVSWGDPFNDRDRLLAFLGTGDLDPTPVISHRFPLAEAAEAYRLFDAREATKVLLTP